MFPPFAWFIQKRVILIGAAALSAAVILLIGRAGWKAQAQASQPEPPSKTLDVPDTVAGPYTCYIKDIEVYVETTRVECQDPVPSTVIFYFASPPDFAHSLVTNRIFTLMNTAFALGKPLQIEYYAEQATGLPQCQATCRLIYYLWINQ